MKCEIIRDLLPSYVDHLTSPESNQAIEEHLGGCAKCKGIYQAMVSSENVYNKDADSSKNLKDIKPFKKLKKRTISAVVATVLICIVAFTGVQLYFAHSWTPKSSDVAIKTSTSNSVAEVQLSSKKDNVTLAVTSEDPASNSYTVEARRTSPFAKIPRVNGYCGVTFVDEDTILCSDGSTMDLKGDEVIKITFEDKVEEINIADLYQTK